MVHHIVMWKFKPEIEEARKPELKKAMAENLKSGGKGSRSSHSRICGGADSFQHP